MERVTPTPPTGYVLTDEEAVKEILEVEAELLRSEGIDPRWPGFPDDSKGKTKKK
jgi:hypothetical protein